MKKTMIGFAVVMAMVASASVFAGNSSNNNASGSDHEGKPCHFVDSNRHRCSCRSCYGNNWGNYYCTRCKHSVQCHY